MTWARLDDRFHQNAKVLALSHGAFRLYVCSITYCRAQGEAGVMSSAVVAALARLQGVPKAAVGELVAAGVFEETATGVSIHHYAAYDPPANATSNRRVQLFRDPALRQAVRSRDGDECQYCHREVDWTDRRGAASGTYDHVDPNGPNSLDNLVVCCRSCNSSKSNLDQPRSVMPGDTRPVPSPVPSPVVNTSPPSTEAATRSKERERVLAWLGEAGREPDYPNANKLCVSEGWTAAEVIAAGKIAIGKHGAKRPLAYIQREVDGHSSLLSRTKVQREEAAHAERKAELAKAARVPNEATGIIEHLAEGMSA